MRTPNLGTAFYVPGEPPLDAAQMQRFLCEELQKISAAVQALAAGHLDKTTVAPTKPRDGDYRYADGVSWKPNGAGAKGFWRYDGDTATWVSLG